MEVLMSAKQQVPALADETASAPPKKPSKKDQIISLWSAGIHEVSDLAHMTQTRPSYVAGVLQDAGLMTGYFDLYTTSNQPMNVYSKYFAGRLGFKDEQTARASLEVLDRFYREWGKVEDRAGQHHALQVALMLFDRARWTGKEAEAALFRNWLVARLQEPTPPPQRAATKAVAKSRARSPK
jgi:hypothetical protein